MIKRSLHEIGDRLHPLRDLRGRDPFGIRREILLQALSYEDARALLPDGVDARQFDHERWGGHRDPEAYARSQLWSAVLNTLAHRSRWAGRSVDQLNELAWLLGHDDVVAAMDAAPYPMYGAPKIKAFADGLDWPLGSIGDNGRRIFARMADGQPCDPDGCSSGCED
ncbi:hypothetical protein [Micromonospora sp. WMMD710]|uniref:hypothetical protein n=1 Tax=Micromonospora sp. WMMD710 TaxID=3016085 RepID=UPI002417DE12|nr:hypothetical protein [Micromonospora sp. WMMD710]MDG4760368.1 hypothetical protein [Micromonospora sp. WMMD710]